MSFTETTVKGKGVTLGPLDPDNAGELVGRLGVHNKADRLLQRHRKNWPVSLVNALSRPRDDLRSETLDLDEVEHALRSLKGRAAFFGEEDVLEDASVRGMSDRDFIVSVVFRKPSGRSAQGVIPYAGLDQSIAAYEAAKAKEDGVLLSAPVGEGQEDPGAIAKAQEEARAAQEARRELEGKLDGVLERVARLEDPEPFEGYDELAADARAKAVREGGLEEFGRRGLERIREYEEAHKNSKQVLAAVEDALAG